MLNYASNQFKVANLIGNEAGPTSTEMMFNTIDESRLSKVKQALVNEVDATIAGQIVKNIQQQQQQ